MLKFLILAGFLLQQQPNEITIEADNQRREGNVITYSGNVVVVYQDLRVEADTMTYNEETQQIVAGDRVVFRRGDEQLDATTATVDLTTKAGVLTNVRGTVGGYYVVAAEARRTDNGSYQLFNATVTTCGDNSPGWIFAAARANVDQDRNVTASNTVFRLEGIPLFYMPYVIAPATERARSSGFLIPSTSTSTTKGRSVRLPFYWAIGRSADATFIGEYFTERGSAGGIDFRAVPNASSRITVNSYFAHDRMGQGGQSARILTNTEFGNGFRGVVDLNLVSSFVFRQVYEEGFNIISSPIEHSLAFLTQNRSHVSYNFLYGRTGIFFTDQPSVALRKFPTVEVGIADRLLTSSRFPVYFSLDAGLSGIARRDAVIKTPSFVQRFDLHPSLEIPVLRTAAFDWSHRVGARETAYTHDRFAATGSDALNRFVLDYASSFAGPRFERNLAGFRHVVEPTMAYRYVRGAERFRDTIVVDEVDLLANTNEVEYGINNRFFAGREVFSWRIAQKYFFDPTFGGVLIPGTRNVLAPLMDITGFAFADGKRRFSPIVSTMRLSTSPSTSTDLQVDYDTEKREFRSAGIIGGLDRAQTFANVAYYFTRRSAIHEPNNQLRGTIGYGNEAKLGLSAAFNFSYDIHRSLFQGSTAQVGYNTDCYGFSFEFTQFDVGARKESRIRFALSLKNIGSAGTLRRQERLF
jgi:LPS-assembly protein